MDQTLKLKLADLKTALNTLEEALRKPKDDFMRDSVIKRFEYSFKLAWKTAKLFLSVELGEEIFSPKEVFRVLRKNKILNEKETEIALIMTDDRNMIVHRYDADFSNKLYGRIKKDYAKLLQEILEKISRSSS